METNEMILIGIVIISGWIPPAIALLIQWKMGKNMLENAKNIAKQAEKDIPVAIEKAIPKYIEEMKKSLINAINGKLGRTARDINEAIEEFEEDEGGLDFLGMIEKKIAQKFKDW